MNQKLRVMFKIEKNVPYSERYRASKVIEELPIDKMEVGDSVQLEKKYDKKAYSRWYSRVKTYLNKKQLNYNVRMGSTNKGDIRLWRTQ